ncbi:MAG: phytanoyl-CoA dioxygenase family protein [Bacteroidota bacterium]
MEIFRDKKLQKRLEQDGIVIVPFLDAEANAALKDYYDAHPLELGLPYHSTVLSKDIAYRRGVHNKIQETFSASLERVFQPNFRFFFGCYTIKEKGEGSEWGVHQDWSFVDETRFRSVGVWCPMLDVDENNGCLGVVRGSHKFFHNIRGTKTITEYAPVAGLIRDKFLDFYPMKAGEAAIFYNNLIHYSPPNLVGPARITANCTMLPKEAQPLHFFRDPEWPETEVEVFEIDTEFLLNNDYISQKRPERGHSRGKINHPVKQLAEAEFEALVRQHQTPNNWLKRIAWRMGVG